MSPVQELLEHTEKLYDHVQKGLPEEKPENYLEELNAYIDYRQKLIERLAGNYNQDEKELGKQLVEINKLIQPYLDNQMVEIKNKLMEIRQKRTNNTKYANPYQGSRADGMYFDKRK